MFPPFSQPGCPLDLNLHSVFTASCLTLDTIMEREWRAGNAYSETQTLQNMALFTFLCFIFVVGMSDSPRSIKLSSPGVRVTHCSLGSTLCQLGSHVGIMTTFLSKQRFLWIFYNNVRLWNKSHFQSFCLSCIRKVFLLLEARVLCWIQVLRTAREISSFDL